ncbi:MAG TPA: sulfotransferase [Caulobacteraceae bacterium]|jgi:hypothetical protein|nr:sulfotransferase [Caulobacteraceae bacterium]
MPLKVIGAGLGRTGTLTLKAALEQLGFGPCHHMTEVFTHPEQAAFWRRAAEGEAVDWEEMFGGYQATVDWPGCHFWRRLADHYPDAKVVLSLRDPERWWESMSETILKALELGNAETNPEARAMRRFIDIIVSEQTFRGDFSRENVIATFERHNAAVRAAFPAGRLLVFEASQGWDPLCGFLGVPIPPGDFPRTNSREEFWARSAPEDMRREEASGAV